jgi:predicted transcriptional regulator
MKGAQESIVEKKLEKVIDLLQRLVALELSRRGVSKAAIGKHIHVAKATVVKMLAGVTKEVVDG